VAIPLKKIKEGCCDNQLNEFVVVDGDALDSLGSTVDKVIECKDRYYLVEEKSILLDFFNKVCQKRKIKFHDFKYTEENSEYFGFTKISEQLSEMSLEEKQSLFNESIIDMIGSSGKKASNTTDILNKKYDNTKTSNMPMIYLYCNSGKAIDKIVQRVLQKRKITFFECQKLKEKLEQEC